MEVIYILIPLSLVLVAVIIGFVVWAVKSGQFEDLDRPAYRILDDDDGLRAERRGRDAAADEANDRDVTPRGR